MRIGFLQFFPERKDPECNSQLIYQALKKADFELLVLPELANCGYLYENPQAILPYCENISQPGVFIQTLAEICANKKACIVSGIAEHEDGQVYNSAIAIGERGVLSVYRKTHLYNSEKLLFTPGNTGFSTFTFRNVCVGIMICFDWIFPEATRTLVLKGAQIIAHPANLVLPYCQRAMRTRSIENGVFTITANRVGSETLNGEELLFTGKSQITNPKGEILASATRDGKVLNIIDIDPRDADFKNISPNNDLISDRRPEFYA